MEKLKEVNPDLICIIPASTGWFDNRQLTPLVYVIGAGNCIHFEEDF